MSVLIVNPPRFNGIPVIREDRCENADRNVVQPPTGMVYMAGILKAEGVKVGLLDCNAYNGTMEDVRRALRETKPEWVITRSTPSTFGSDIAVVEMAKVYGAKTVMLNWNLSAFSEKVMERTPSLDYYLTDYSYENLLVPLVRGKKLKRGVTYREDDEIVVKKEKGFRKVGDIPAPPWDLLPDHSVFYTRAKAISPWGVVRGSKGCGYSCLMCSDCGRPWDPRSPEAVVDEVQDLVENHGIKYLSFFDNTFTVDQQWATEVADGIADRKLKLRWFINTRPELLPQWLVDVMVKAGLDGVSLGIEFGTDRCLEKINKRFTVAEGMEACARLKKSGVKIYLSLMMGGVGETKKEMMATKDLVLKIKPHGFQFSIVTPYPGTPIYKECLDDGLIDEGLDWNTMSCVPTGLKGTVSLSKLTGAELVTLRKQFYRSLYLHPLYFFPNVWWTLTHPQDLWIAASYVFGLGKTMWNKVTYTH